LFVAEFLFQNFGLFKWSISDVPPLKTKGHPLRTNASSNEKALIE